MNTGVEFSFNNDEPERRLVVSGPTDALVGHYVFSAIEKFIDPVSDEETGRTDLRLRASRFIGHSAVFTLNHYLSHIVGHAPFTEPTLENPIALYRYHATDVLPTARFEGRVYKTGIVSEVDLDSINTEMRRFSRAIGLYRSAGARRPITMQSTLASRPKPGTINLQVRPGSQVTITEPTDTAGNIHIVRGHTTHGQAAMLTALDAVVAYTYADSLVTG